MSSAGILKRKLKLVLRTLAPDSRTPTTVILFLLLAFGQGGPNAVAVAPLNDFCSGAETIPAAGPFPYLTAVTADIRDATTTNDPGVPSCVDGSVTRSIWYTFTPSATATYTISDCLDTGTTVADTAMAIYTSTGGCAGPFNQVACSDDECGIRAAISTTLSAGATYYIVVWKWGTLSPPAGSTAIQLRISVPAAAANDTCAGAEIIPDAGPFPHLTAVTDAALALKTGDPSTPSCAGQVTRSVWYRFTPQTTATYTISACRPDSGTTVYDTLMAIYSVPIGCGGAFTQIGCNEDACVFRSSIAVSLTAGQTYFIVVWETGNSAAIIGETAVQLRVSTTALGVSPPILNFSGVITGMTVQASFTVANTGGSTINGNATITNGGPFSVLSGSPFSLSSGGATNVVIRFAPTAIGAFSNSVIFASDGGDATNTLIGTGVTIPPGDVNGDARVTGADSLLIAQVQVGLRSNTDPIFATAGFANGDINTNGVVTGGDSLLINQVLVGLRSYIVTRIFPPLHVSNQTTTVTIYGIGFPTNVVPSISIGAPVNLTLTNVVVVSREHITATIPPGGGLGTGTVNVIYATTNGVISFGRFINQ